MFVDSSAIVAIMASESDGTELRRRLKSSRRRTVSPLVVYETVMAVRRLKQMPMADALGLVEAFLRIFAIKSVAIEMRTTAIALETFERFGKGQGHPAALNMGDCYSYACASLLKVPLLCKGDDFIHTDIRIA